MSGKKATGKRKRGSGLDKMFPPIDLSKYNPNDPNRKKTWLDFFLAPGAEQYSSFTIVEKAPASELALKEAVKQGGTVSMRGKQQVVEYAPVGPPPALEPVAAAPPPAPRAAAVPAAPRPAAERLVLPGANWNPQGTFLGAQPAASVAAAAAGRPAAAMTATAASRALKAAPGAQVAPSASQVAATTTAVRLGAVGGADAAKATAPRGRGGKSGAVQGGSVLVAAAGGKVVSVADKKGPPRNTWINQPDGTKAFVNWKGERLTGAEGFRASMAAKGTRGSKAPKAGATQGSEEVVVL